MFSLPKIEPITRDATFSHFFLMFGYKLFSSFFPLYLVSKSFSIMQVGYTSFLIYLPIALFAPIAGFLNHKIKPSILLSVGILGYGIYSLGMLLFTGNSILFYILQIILGVSASLFFVSARNFLMSANLENPDRAFGWFYSANSYADAFAPATLSENNQFLRPTANGRIAFSTILLSMLKRPSSRYRIRYSHSLCA